MPERCETCDLPGFHANTLACIEALKGWAGERERRYVLAITALLGDLPMHRDWLDPRLERELRALVQP